MGKKFSFSAFLVGGLAGAALGILFAPRKGEETREMIYDKIDEYRDDLQDFYPYGMEDGGFDDDLLGNVEAGVSGAADSIQSKGAAIKEHAKDAEKSLSEQASGQTADVRAKIEAARERLAQQVATSAKSAQGRVESGASGAKKAVDKGADKAKATLTKGAKRGRSAVTNVSHEAKDAVEVARKDSQKAIDTAQEKISEALEAATKASKAAADATKGAADKVAE